MHFVAFPIVIAISLSASVYAANLPVWKELTFLQYKPIEFTQKADTIHIQSNSAASMLYRPLSKQERNKKMLSWQWRVDDSSVTPTPLNLDDGDDRTLGVYVFYTKEPIAIDDITFTDDVYYLAYIWGSVHSVDEVVESHDGRGQFIIIRNDDPSVQEWHAESVDYSKDFRRAFGFDAYPVYIAIAADTDDTNSKTIAAIKNIIFK